MSKKIRNHLPQFKAKVALAALKGDKTLLRRAAAGCQVVPDARS